MFYFSDPAEPRHHLRPGGGLQEAPEAGDSVSAALRRAPPGKLEAECAGRGRGQG